MIIHNSSLAYSPVAYNKPQTANAENNGTSADDGKNKNLVKQGSEQNAQPSSTAQIQSALISSGLPSDNVYSQPNNTYAHKALNAYTQNRNQAIKTQIRQSISGIDLYA